jgi:hypothetical protein
MTNNFQLIDWSEQCSDETPLQVTVRQSTVCLCGKRKEIGAPSCGCGTLAPKTTESWQ